MNNEEDTMYIHLNQAVATERLIDDLGRSEAYHAARIGSPAKPSVRRTLGVRWPGRGRLHASRRAARA